MQHFFTLRTRRSKHTMKSVLPACLLLLWTLTAPVSCDTGPVIEVTENNNGINLKCIGGSMFKKNDKDEGLEKLEYKDENTGEYFCVDSKNNDVKAKLFVKFRTCDNCIELDAGSITGMVIGNVVATAVIGVSVYLLASQARIGPVTSHKKSSDRPRPVPNNVGREPNDHYQSLKVRQKETYDVLNTARP
ncbi:T-cell surface glycoprotein CD3 delta chain-like isoform X2 [Anoplopoma fimbria]|uniref:T-cell surface glycoprotein CD3 delta chain-like isoform X2 n=1 Tax=Anoplopoma fimbria TaxID=229290 RepID=UPI0023EBFF29|nr:T-cell surface glycoprotein CD3 delta chain-like isoform X2 [Anoplopoma fimbria]